MTLYFELPVFSKATSDVSQLGARRSHVAIPLGDGMLNISTKHNIVMKLKDYWYFQSYKANKMIFYRQRIISNIFVSTHQESFKIT